MTTFKRDLDKICEKVNKIQGLSELRNMTLKKIS